MRIVLRVFLVLFVLLILGAASAAGILYYMNQPGERVSSEGISFTVNPGENLTLISNRLTVAGIIRHPLIMRVITTVENTGNSLKAGTYLIKPGMTALEVHNLLLEGKQEMIKLTIPEGWSMRQIALRVEDELGTSHLDFIEAATNPTFLEKYGIPSTSAEGFLFPDTYFFTKEYPAEKVVTTMVDNFFNRVSEINPEYQKLSMKKLYERLILASIVEREYRVAEEAPLMASVFENRLKIWMPLESCATVAYVITEELGLDYPTVLTYQDLKITSPFNTYLNYGLPPAPISNPGEVALKAAFFPVKSDYLFFVKNDAEKGTHHFSKSLSEHNRAKNFYLKEY